MNPPPDRYLRLRSLYPALFSAYEALGEQAGAAGPLDSRSRELVKLGLAIGARLEGATHAHVRRALTAGCTPDEIRQVALLAVTTLGFPTMMIGLGWVEDVLGAQADPP
jgi:4-carboxymuconolactone decarboxylase